MIEQLPPLHPAALTAARAKHVCKPLCSAPLTRTALARASQPSARQRLQAAADKPFSNPFSVARTVAQVEVGDRVQRGAAAALAQQVARRQAHHRRAHAGLHLGVLTLDQRCALKCRAPQHLSRAAGSALLFGRLDACCCK